jgi:hypothetical protein
MNMGTTCSDKHMYGFGSTIIHIVWYPNRNGTWRSMADHQLPAPPLYMMKGKVGIIPQLASFPRLFRCGISFCSGRASIWWLRWSVNHPTQKLRLWSCNSRGGLTDYKWGFHPQGELEATNIVFESVNTWILSIWFPKTRRPKNHRHIFPE